MIGTKLRREAQRQKQARQTPALATAKNQNSWCEAQTNDRRLEPAVRQQPPSCYRQTGTPYERHLRTAHNRSSVLRIRRVLPWTVLPANNARLRVSQSLVDDSFPSWRILHGLRFKSLHKTASEAVLGAVNEHAQILAIDVQ